MFLQEKCDRKMISMTISIKIESLQVIEMLDIMTMHDNDRNSLYTL